MIILSVGREEMDNWLAGHIDKESLALYHEANPFAVGVRNIAIIADGLHGVFYGQRTIVVLRLREVVARLKASIIECEEMSFYNLVLSIQRGILLVLMP